MVEYVDEVKRILEIDPTIPGIDCLSHGAIPEAVAFLRQNPQYSYVSEWRDDLLGETYFVKAHDKKTGEYLKELVEKRTVRKPTLLYASSIDDLLTIMDEAA